MDLREQLHLFVRTARAGHLTQADILREVRREFILASLVANRFNQCRAARELGRHRNSLQRQCVALGIDVAELKKQAGRAPAESKEQLA